jgi:SH3 domain protein
MNVEITLRGLGIYLFLLLALFTGTAIAETIYVHDYLRVGIRADPNSTDVPVAVVTTGDALEVLEEQDGYYKIRAESGVEGWVSKSYVSNEIPARLLLEKSQKESTRLRDEAKTLQGQLMEKSQQFEEQQQQLSELLDENSKLHQKVSQYYSATARGMKSYTWLYQFLGIAILFVLGIYLGVRWERRRVAERLGGLEL